MNSPTWFGVTVIMLSAVGTTLRAQEAPPSPPSSASIVVMPARFATLNDEAHLLAPGVNLTSDTTRVWWGIGKGATIGATAALGVTQVFCGDDNGCVGRSIGAVFIGSLLGGAIESGLDY